MSDNEFYLNSIWSEVLDYIAKNQMIAADVFEMIAKDSRIFTLNEKQATLVCDLFITVTVIQNQYEAFELAFEEVTKRKVKVIAKLAKNLVKNEAYPVNAKIIKKYLKTKINAIYNFDNFVVGRSNAQSQLSALTIANNPGVLYNPLFIYGNSGLGKTHLLNAIGNKILFLFPNYKIALISGLDFVEGVFDSIKNKRIDEFKTEFYDLDVLLVDDIQFIAGKEKTHEIFFSVFNELVNNKKQVVLTSDRIPKEIKGLEDRIISRFNQGLNVGISAPEFETAVNILKKKLSSSLGQTIDEDVLAYIAANFSKDVRQLEGALNRLLFYSISFHPVDHIDLAVAKEAFADQIKEENSELDINRIKKAICNYYGLTAGQLNSKIRTKNIAIPRQIAMYLARKRLDMSYKDIGYNFGKRDHSTVISACERVEEKIKKDPLYQRSIVEVEALLD